MAKIYQATGKRKSSIAKVTMTNGTGKIIVNGRDVREYFPFETLVMDLEQPLDITGTKDLFDIECSVKGGGFRGQSGAIRLGITKALLAYDTTTKDSENSLRKPLKANGMITRDARVKERKKYGLKKARRAPQFSKR